MELNGSINDDVDVIHESSRSLADTRGVQLELQGQSQGQGHNGHGGQNFSQSPGPSQRDANSNKQTPFAPKNVAQA